MWLRLSFLFMRHLSRAGAGEDVAGQGCTNIFFNSRIIRITHYEEYGICLIWDFFSRISTEHLRFGRLSEIGSLGRRCLVVVATTSILLGRRKELTGSLSKLVRPIVGGAPTKQKMPIIFEWWVLSFLNS
jgi:hypothetical protein